jgi:phosphoribosylglycinamide formyltransferase 1
MTLRLGVLISGSGTNLQAIIDAAEAGTLDADIRVVVSNHASARGLDRAAKHGIDAVFVDRGAYTSVREYNAALRDEFYNRGVDWIVMAGYMRLLGKEVLDFYPNRVINLHPAILPSFAGANGIRDAFDYGVKVTGVTVHFANENFDEGPILAQEPVIIAEDDTVETLEAKIHATEHRLLPAALQLIAEGRVEIVGRKVRIAPAS